MGGGGSKKKREAEAKEQAEPEPEPEPEPELTFKVVHSAIRWDKPAEHMRKMYARDAGAASMQDDRNGNFPLHIAAQNGFTPHVQLLLDHGADINAVNFKGNTAMHMALSYDYIETVELLVAAGAEVDKKNTSGFRAAMGIDGDKSRGIVYLLAAKTTAEALSALGMIESNPDDNEKANFVSKAMGFKKRLTKEESKLWTEECDARMKEVMGKLH